VPIALPLTPDRILDVIEGRAVEAVASTALAEPEAGEAVEASSEAPGTSAALAGVDPEDVEPDTGKTAAGKWHVVMNPPVGAPQEMTATFEIDGTALSGRFDSDQGSQEFSGTAEGNRLKWEMKVTQPVSLTLKYDLTVSGDTLSGKAKLGILGSAKVSGTRL
jgi:aerobic carbon-monoxide dehydrogenase large subunit